MRTLFCIILSLNSALLYSSDVFKLPSPETQKNIIIDLRDEMIRLDGEGLTARKDRLKSFIETTDELSIRALENKDQYDFYNSFLKLGSTYTNIHSYTIFPRTITSSVVIPWNYQLSHYLFVKKNGNDTEVVLDYVSKGKEKENINIGDKLVAINDKPISLWLEENFLFCKYPLRKQCDLKLEENLHRLKLSWKFEKPLVYSFKNNQGEINKVEVSFFKFSSKPNPLRNRCDYNWEKKYPGFELKFTGFHLCYLEKKDDPSIAIVRISSFYYDTRKFSGLKYYQMIDEVMDFKKLWDKKHHQVNDLIFDMIDNRGGHSPLPYYSLFFQNEFQEQYIKYKKTPELEDEELRSAMIWKKTAHELAILEYITSDLWQEIEYGEFLPQMSLFCKDPYSPCTSEETYKPMGISFNGNIHIMLNENCISSCDAFVWNFKNNTNAKLYGFPNASDSSSARLRIDVTSNEDSPKGFDITISPQHETIPKNLIIAQVIAPAQTTDQLGNLLNGTPEELEIEVPHKSGEYYSKTVLEKLMNEVIKN